VAVGQRRASCPGYRVLYQLLHLGPARFVHLKFHQCFVRYVRQSIVRTFMPAQVLVIVFHVYGLPFVN
jgi:hypothetical protein